MPFKDYMEFTEPLQLPVGGKVYTLPLVGAADAPKLLHVGTGDVTGAELERILLGDVAEVLKEDNVPALAVTRMMLTALVEVQAGRDAAETFWESGKLPEGLAALLAAASRTSPRTGADATTPPPAGSNTTNSRPTKARASRGTKSSNSGPSSRTTSKANTK